MALTVEDFSIGCVDYRARSAGKLLTKDEAMRLTIPLLRRTPLLNCCIISWISSTSRGEPPVPEHTGRDIKSEMLY